MRKWKLMAGVLLIFSAGVLVGSFCTGYGISYFYDRFKGDQKYRVDFILKRLTQELDLSDSQRKEIRTILFDADQELNQFWAKVITQADQKMEVIEKEIEKQLSADQVVRFEMFREEVKARRGGQNAYIVPSLPAKNSPSE